MGSSLEATCVLILTGVFLIGLVVGVGIGILIASAPPASPEGTLLPETLIKNITVKDKLTLDGRNLVYTTDREIFSTGNLFLYRELAVNGTYFIEYKPLDPGRAFNVYGLSGRIQTLDEVRDA
jgi:hypothetical protein